MLRRNRLVLLLGCCALLLGGLALLWLGGRERAALRRQLGAERLRAVQQAARALEDDFEDIGEDLRLAGQLVLAARSAEDRERELRALLAVVKHYRMAAVFDAAGRASLSVEDPRAPLPQPAERFADALASAATRALQQPADRVETSAAVLRGAAGWYRVLATALPRDGVHAAESIAFLVDTGPLFAKELQALRSAPGTHVLLLGAHGGAMPATEPALAAAAEAAGRGGPVPPAFSGLLGALRRGAEGTLVLDEDAGERLGLGGAQVVAFAPVRIKDGGHWSLAVLTSARELRPQEQARFVRLGLLAGLATVLFGLAGGYAAYGARRAAALRERLRQADQLAHLHEKTEKILDHMPAGVLALADDGRITALNRALRERVPGVAIDAPLAAAFPQASPQALAQLRELVDGALVSERVRSLHGARLHLFGAEGQYSLHAVPLEPRIPEARVLLVIEDQSALRSLESQLLRAEKLATVGVLAAGIAHEIGTPLGVIRGRAEYVAGKLGDGHPQAAGVLTIVEQIDHVTRTLRQLLDFARVRPAAVRPVLLAQAAGAVIELFRIEAERRGLTLAASVPADLPPLSADPDQLQQVLVNLVMNACDACVPGGRVILSASRPAGAPGAACARVEVRDDGCGIPEEHRNQVFDPFFTTKKRGQGTGLGLTLAAQIVRSHQGQIEIESEPGQGTRVVVLWPLAPAKGHHGQQGAEAHPDRG